MDPRVVLVRRETAYESLLREHGTIQMASFRLSQRGESLEGVREQHEAVMSAATLALGRVPTTWRKTWVLRRDLDRFRFDPEDIVVAVGLDGLVPNVAKYLDAQPVIGVNPTSWSQRMMHFRAEDLPHLYASAADPKRGVETGWATERRTMVEATLDDGRRIVALNEIYCGHHTHQSSKYDLSCAGSEEYQSSSGIIVTTGTGATGWASSIAKATGIDDAALPSPTSPSVYYLVREAWASSFTGTDLVRGPVVEGAALAVTSKMQEGGVLFGDGIEQDALRFAWGQTAEFGVSARGLSLVIPSKKKGRKAAAEVEGTKRRRR